MTVVNQLSAIPVPGGDLVFKNYSASVDIPAGVGVLFDGTNKGDANNAPGVVPIGTGAAPTLTCGVTLEIIKAGGHGKVRMLGGAIATANATINPGQLVEIDGTSGHEGQIKVAASTDEILGKALSAAVAGDPILIWVMPTAHN